MRSTIRGKLLARMLFVAALPLLVFGLLAYYNLALFHESDVAGIESNLLNQKIQEINAFVRKAKDIFRLRVATDKTGDLTVAEQRFILSGLLQEVPALEEASFISLSGEESERYSRAYPTGTPREYLQNYRHINKFLTAKAGQDYAGRVYFTLKGPMITLAAPVFNNSNRVIAVISGELRLSELQSIIERSFLGTRGYLYIIDQSGYLIAHSQADRLTAVSLSQSGFNSTLTRGGSFVGEGGTRRYTSFWNEPVVAAGQFLKDYGWGLVAEWPTDEADWLVNNLLKQMLLVLLLVVAATLLLSWLAASTIVKPIKQLIGGTARIAKGKFDEPVNIKSGDELEQLGASFNAMTVDLRRLEELKKEFVFIAAHELRTPVTAIRGYLSMVLDGDTGPLRKNTKEYLGQVNTANDRLIQLVNDLLEVARSEAGRLSIKVKPIDIAEPVKAVLKEIKPLADEKKIKLIYNAAAKLPWALADADRVKEVMVNLVGNAIKYTLGGGTVRIENEVVENKLITHVRDTGLGISAEAQKKLFEKFYRVQTDQTSQIQGTGLGLFIVKEIVEKMGGQVSVKSMEGKGSTFSFWLPLA